MQGSAVTGQSFRTGEAFDYGRTSDFDIALVSQSLLEKAQDLGVGLRSQSTRTGPLRPRDLEKLGLTDMANDLSIKYGRDVNFMIFNSSENSIQKAPSIEIKK